MELTEKTLSKKEIYDGRIVHLHVDEVELPDGRKSVREVVDHVDGVCIAAENEQGELMFVRQYRYPCAKVVLELPAGKLEPGEDPMECAKRELLEETGAISDHFIYLGKVYASPGFCNEAIHLYYTRIKEMGEMQPDDGEFLNVETIGVEKAVQMCVDGTIEDAKTVSALLKVMFVR